MTAQAYFDSKSRAVGLGKVLGKGAAATVYFDGNDPATAIKIFLPEFLAREPTLPERLDKLYKLRQVSDLEIRFGALVKPVGSLPKDVVKDRRGRIVGYKMDTVVHGINLEQIVFARNPGTAFYKYRQSVNYPLWLSTFLYRSDTVRNRFILSYYLSHSFDRIYSIRTKTGQKLDVDICNFDVKPKNILVAIEHIGGKPNIIPYVLDLDNITIRNDTGQLAPLHPQYTPEYKAPEGPVDRYYDYYSIAVIFYQLIFDIHPFNVLGGTRFMDGTEMDFFVRNKCFAWGRNRKFLSRQTQDDPRHNNFTRIPESLQRLFIRAFDSDVPALRPSMKEWMMALENLLSDPAANPNRRFVVP